MRCRSTRLSPSRSLSSARRRRPTTAGAFRPRRLTYDEAIELVDAGLFVEAATYRGKPDVVKYLGRIEGAFEDIHLEPLEFIERPPAVVVPFRLSGHGGKLQMIINAAFWIRDRKIRRIQTFRSRQAALGHPYARPSIVG